MVIAKKVGFGGRTERRAPGRDLQPVQHGHLRQPDRHAAERASGRRRDTAQANRVQPGQPFTAAAAGTFGGLTKLSGRPSGSARTARCSSRSGSTSRQWYRRVRLERDPPYETRNARPASIHGGGPFFFARWFSSPASARRTPNPRPCPRSVNKHAGRGRGRWVISEFDALSRLAFDRRSIWCCGISLETRRPPRDTVVGEIDVHANRQARADCPPRGYPQP